MTSPPSPRRAGIPVAATSARSLAPLAAAAVVVLLVSVQSGYHTYLAGYIAVFVLVTLGLNLLIGLSGLLSLASAAFMALGAYATIILQTRQHFPVVAALAAATVGGWLAGWLLGLVSLRLSHFYLALISLGFLLALRVILLRGGDLTGSGYGLVTPPASVAGHDMTPADWAYAAVFLAVVSLLLASQVAASRVGRAWRALKHSETLAELCGVNLLRNKTSSFALSSGLAALAGGLYAFLQGAVNPDAFGLSASVDLLAFVIVGGLGSVWGALLGSTAMLLLPEYLRSLGDKRELVFGALVLVVLVVAPSGLAGLVQRAVGIIPAAARQRIRRLFHGHLTPWSQAPAAGRPAAAALDPASGERLGRLVDQDSLATPSRQRSDPAQVALRVHGVSVHYGGVRAVQDAHFEVRRGALHGVIGPNGAGKTTLLNALTGLVPLAGGTISLGETALRGPGGGTRRRDLASLGVTRTFQTPLVVPELTAVENVMLGLHGRLRSGLVGSAVRSPRAVREDRRARQECLEALHLLGVDADVHAPASTLGFGELRRVELARCLVARPRLLVLDEPTSGLELDEAHRTVELLRRVQESDHELTIVLVEHNVPLVFGQCDAVTAMHEGRVLVTDVPEIVREDPAVRDSYLITSAMEVEP